MKKPLSLLSLYTFLIFNVFWQINALQIDLQDFENEDIFLQQVNPNNYIIILKESCW